MKLNSIDGCLQRVSKFEYVEVAANMNELVNKFSCRNNFQQDDSKPFSMVFRSRSWRKQIWYYL